MISDDAALLADLKLPGDESEAATLTAMIPGAYEELRRLAAGYLRDERSDHTLQPTALVHEVYLRLADQSSTQWRNRAHFLGIAARMMRRIRTERLPLRTRRKNAVARMRFVCSLTKLSISIKSATSAWSLWTQRCIGWKNSTKGRRRSLSFAFWPE